MQFTTTALVSALMVAAAQATVTSSVTATVSSVVTQTVTSCGASVTDCPATLTPSSTLDAGHSESTEPSSTLDAFGSTYANATTNYTSAAIQSNWTGAAVHTGGKSSFTLALAAVVGAAAVFAL